MSATVYLIPSRVKRLDSSRVVTLLQDSAMVIQYSKRDDIEQATPGEKESIAKWQKLSPVCTSVTDLSELIMWVSSRSEGWNHFDAQQVGSAVFDRGLIRECLQPLIDENSMAPIKLSVCRLHGGHILWISSRRFGAAAMSLDILAKPGRDPMPVGWATP